MSLSTDEKNQKRANKTMHCLWLSLQDCFFILGFATWLNGSLMPYLKQILQLSPFQASLILFSFYIAVTFTALPSAAIIRRG